MSENWGFAVFETDRYKLVVDEDAVTPCQLFDLHEDPAEDSDLLPDPLVAPVAEEIMETHVRPFFRNATGAAPPQPLHGRLRRVRHPGRRPPSGDVSAVRGGSLPPPCAETCHPDELAQGDRPQQCGERYEGDASR